MAVASGTATDYLDLLSKVKVHLTDPALLGTEVWTVKRWQNSGAPSENELILVGSGLAGDDEVYIGVSGFFNAASDYYSWRVNGFTSYSAGQDFDSQPGAIPRASYPPVLPLWNSSITYWLIANGRRIVLITKVSTVYEALYLGFIHPYATPGQFAYPLVVGGSLVGYNSNRYSYTGNEHRWFGDPKQDTTTYTSLALRGPAGSWKRGNNASSTGVHTFPYYQGGTDMTRTDLTCSGLFYLLMPVMIYEDSPTNNVYGELDGCYWLTGKDNSAENMVTISGQDYMVVPNTYRSGQSDYWAIKLY